ncbi:MAG: peptidylprolyl isomerase [Saprospiraceae bacterium]|nr:peptidylprolyl isomerase [Saprospiraceae bacterium]
MSKYLPLLILAIGFFTQCVPPSEEKAMGVHLDYTNSTYQAIYDLKDRGQTDSLIRYFKSKDATVRYMAVMAFASLKDSTAIDSLSSMLSNDVEESIRIAAAYSLGQIGNVKAQRLLLEGFDRGDTAGVYKNVNAAIMEAIGKCGTKEMLDNLAGITTYTLKDTALMVGQAWGIYRFAMRESVSAIGTAKMLDFATGSKYPTEVRFVAANYLSRAKRIDLTNGDSLIGPALAREEDYRVRMALAIALGKTKTVRAANALLYQYNIERDYRVKCNILRAFGNVDYALVKATVYNALSDPNLPVAVTAANFFIDNGVAEEAGTYWEIAKQPGRKWEVATAMYAAASKHLPYGFEETRKYLNWEIKRRFENAASPYEKAAALDALSQYGWNYRYIRDAGYPSEFIAVRTASVKALANIASMRNFNGFFGGGAAARSELRDCFTDAISTGDPGMMAEAAIALRDSSANFKSVFDSVVVLENALKKLRLPQEIETYNELKKTIEFFKGTKYSTPTKPKFTHKIDWKIITDFKPGTRVNIKTKKGSISLDLLVDEAPGTVSNFLELIKDKYYNGKNFHRVVPNFVVQGGCSRGDGYGGPNYAIRSELSNLRYDQEGYVGMASAGNNTESAQFFITHSPAPHLDGNYTIFAKVAAGMDVVHKLEIGDIIEEMTIVEPK